MNNNDKLSEFDVCCCPAQHVTEERERTNEDTERENYLRTIAYDLVKTTNTAKEVLDVEFFAITLYPKTVSLVAGYDVFTFYVNEDGSLGDATIVSLKDINKVLRAPRKFGDDDG